MTTATTPRLATARPDQAHNVAAILLAVANPGVPVLYAEEQRESLSDPRVQNSIGARLISLKRRKDAPEGLQVWTRAEGLTVRGFLQVGPSIVEPAPELDAREKARLASIAYRRKFLGQSPSNERTRAAKKDRNARAIERTVRADGRVIALSSSNDTSPETVARFRRRQKSLLDYAQRSGVKIKTRVLVSENTTWITARLVTS